MRSEGLVEDLDGVPHYKASDGQWYELNSKRAHMAHRIHEDYWPEGLGRQVETRDAVTWWNKVGRFTEPRSDFTRNMMNDPRNYYIEYGPINSRDGALLKQEYLPAVRPKR